MQDRNVEFPNRFRMVKVEGTDDIYDVIPAPGEVISEGDTFSKQNMLPDHIPALLGLKMGNPQVKDALNVLANIGNVHVWSFTDADGNTEFLTSTNPDAYPNGEVDRQDAGYTLESPVSINLMNQSENQSVYTIWKYADSVVVSDAGAVSLSNPSTANISASNGLTDGSKLKGKFVYLVDDVRAQFTDVTPGVIYFIPSDATLSGYLAGGWRYTYDKAQQVIGYPATNAGEYTYLGQLGELGAKIEVGSYVGTGTAGMDNPNSLTFDFVPKFVKINKKNGSHFVNEWTWVYGNSCVITNHTPSSSYSHRSQLPAICSGNTLSWYNSESDSPYQGNENNVSYFYIAIG